MGRTYIFALLVLSFAGSSAKPLSSAMLLAIYKSFFPSSLSFFDETGILIYLKQQKETALTLYHIMGFPNPL